jgi:hypothetical protein
MTWEDLAACHRYTAQHLFGTKVPTHDRAICGRAYYAAYALVTARLSRSTIFGRGWRNPEHGKLPAYVEQIAGLRNADRSSVRRALRRLRQRREDADYRPGSTVDTRTALESMRDVSEVFRILDGNK